MFKNPGGKLKGLAKVVFWLELILFILSGLMVIIAGLSGSDIDINLPGSYRASMPPVASIIAGILIIAFGIFIAWLSTISLYAFGELVESNDKILQIVGSRRPAAAAPQAAPQAAQAPAAAPAAQNNYGGYTIAAPQQPESGKCPYCGTATTPGMKFCTLCGRPLQ